MRRNGLMREIMIRTLYKILGRIVSNSYHHIVIFKGEEISSCLVDSTMLWQKRLGHIRQKGLRAIHSKGMVEGFPDCSSNFDFCEHSVYEK